MPHLGSNHIRQFGTGTERVESLCAGAFPGSAPCAGIPRPPAGRAEAILGDFTQHRADVLVGTQLLAKGLDLPLVTLVGVVLAMWA